jgi:energy-converting hydrogenase B subunit D
MEAAELALDVLLVLTLLALAWRALAVRDLFRAAVLFIVFGLLMSIAWARLYAPDLALAEAAVGAGLTGVLLVRAARAMQARRDARRNRHQGPP